MTRGRTRESERCWQLARGAVAIFGGYELGVQVANILQHSNNPSVDIAARATEIGVACLLLPALADRGARAFKTLIIDNIKEGIAFQAERRKRRRQSRGREVK